jgi:hypothetical protein
MAPQESPTPRDRAQRERTPMGTRESSASAHPSTEEPPHDHQDDIEAHYAGLERLRPCACLEGWVFVGYIDEYGEEREASYACCRCADSR